MTAAAAPAAAVARPAQATLGEAFRVWAKIALLSFGGPAGQIAVMHRVLVEEKRWIGEHRFLHALNYCMLLPGPEAQQLATYIGWLLHKRRGGVMAGLLFILPGVVSIMALSWIYVLYGRLGIVAALFFGLKAAVLAIVVQAVLRIAGRALKNPVMIAIAATAFVALFLFSAPFPLVVVGAGVIGFVGGRRGVPAFAVGGGHKAAGGAIVADEDTLLGEELPAHATPTLARTLVDALVWLALWLVPVALLLVLLGRDDVFSQIALFFSSMAMVTFGGAYAVLSYVAQEAVQTYHWLQPREMLDGLGMAETTPGPLIMVLQFVGFLGAYREATGMSPLLAGTLGGLLATWVTFAPCFLWIFLGAPFIERMRSNRAMAGALSAITAAVVGVILNLAIWFAFHTLFRQTVRLTAGPLAVDLPRVASIDLWAALLCLAAVVAMFRWKAGAFTTLAMTSAAGIALHLFGMI
ncbi:chromate efflux transporter [Sphingomonas sp. C8-2]|jgi:chromate transporter|nr:chromate efflux transporter [Sphingomonas sp. C8-2]